MDGLVGAPIDVSVVPQDNCHLTLVNSLSNLLVDLTVDALI